MTLRVPAPTVTAPDFKTDPVGWCIWLLRENPSLYRAYRDAADELFRRNPNAKRVSSDMILHHVRFETLAAGHGDAFKANNNASPLFARIYRFERPQHRDAFELRDSFLDHLDSTSKRLLNEAVEGMGKVRQPAMFEQPRRAWREATRVKP